jgi:hypothetical protein
MEGGSAYNAGVIVCHGEHRVKERRKRTGSLESLKSLENK